MKTKDKPRTAYFLKILNDRRNGGYTNYRWPRIGRWTERICWLHMCQSGYHLLRPKDLSSWYDSPCGTRVFLVKAEIDGMLISNSKVVAHRAMLIKELKGHKDFIPNHKKRYGNLGRKAIIKLGEIWGIKMTPYFIYYGDDK